MSDLIRLRAPDTSGDGTLIPRVVSVEMEFEDMTYRQRTATGTLKQYAFPGNLKRVWMSSMRPMTNSEANGIINLLTDNDFAVEMHYDKFGTGIWIDVIVRLVVYERVGFPNRDTGSWESDAIVMSLEFTEV